MKIRSSSQWKSSADYKLTSHTYSPSRPESRPKLFVYRQRETGYTDVTDDKLNPFKQMHPKITISRDENISMAKQTLSSKEKNQSERE